MSKRAELKVLSGIGEVLHKWKPDLICEVLPDYVGRLNKFFANTPYRKFLITPDCLQERSELQADFAEFRDYYLSCSPLLEAQLS